MTNDRSPAEALRFPGLPPEDGWPPRIAASFYRPDNDSLNTAPMFCAIVEEHAAVTINPEHSAFDWVDLNDADSRLMWPSDRQALAELRSVILGDGIAKEYMRIPL